VQKWSQECQEQIKRLYKRNASYIHRNYHDGHLNAFLFQHQGHSLIFDENCESASFDENDGWRETEVVSDRSIRELERNE
jgi:hypothetical protein